MEGYVGDDFFDADENDEHLDVEHSGVITFLSMFSLFYMLFLLVSIHLSRNNCNWTILNIVSKRFKVINGYKC